MIALSMQIKAIIFSLVYGVFISFMVNVNYKCLFNKNMIFKIIFDSIFILDLGMLYFFLFYNLLILVIYMFIFFFLLFLLAFLLFSFFKKLMRKNDVKNKQICCLS